MVERYDRSNLPIDEQITSTPAHFPTHRLRNDVNEWLCNDKKRK